MVVFSNRSYYNDEEHQELMAQLGDRPVENKIYGIRIEKPEADFATIARSFDVWSRGPITEPAECPKVLGEALGAVWGGKPALAVVGERVPFVQIVQDVQAVESK